MPTEALLQLPFIASLVGIISASKYLLLLIGTFFEGPVVMMGAGFLWHLGQVEFLPAYAAVVAGDFAADLVWYWVGYFGARRVADRFGHWIGATPRVIEHIELLFRKYDVQILAASKLTLGFGTGTATLLTAGVMRIPFTRYALVNLLAGFIWTFLLMVLGYYFGDLYAHIQWSYRIALIVVTLIIFFFGIRAFSRRIAQKLQ